MKHVLVLGAQVPFVQGGAELLNESLVREINKLDGIKAELVNMPYKWYPEEQMLNDIMAWRLVDLSEANGVKIDLVIGTKFPTYAIKHENKVLWLVHQFRQMYDLANTEFDSAHGGEQVTRNKIKSLDNKFFNECQKIYTIAETVSERLKKFNNFDSAPLLPPPALSSQIIPGDYGDYILYVGRLDPMKRIDLLIQALAETSKGKAIIAGKGTEYDNLFKLIKEKKLEDRCKLVGFVSDDELIEYLSHARAVYYAPIDEDYGYATIEAFLAKKPVITCSDSGEVEKIVRKTSSGIICESTEKSISSAINKVFSLSDVELEEMSQNGFEFAKKIQWDEIIQKLVLDNLK